MKTLIKKIYVDFFTFDSTIIFFCYIYPSASKNDQNYVFKYMQKRQVSVRKQQHKLLMQKE